MCQNVYIYINFVSSNGTQGRCKRKLKVCLFKTDSLYKKAHFDPYFGAALWVEPEDAPYTLFIYKVMVLISIYLLLLSYFFYIIIKVCLTLQFCI